MGATARRLDAGTAEERHELTGKLGPGGEQHAPEWGDWACEWGDIWVRWCRHPNCDAEERAGWDDLHARGEVAGTPGEQIARDLDARRR